MRYETDDPTMPAERVRADERSFMGQTGDRGTIDLRRFPSEGYASIRCGGTEVLIDYTTLAAVALTIDGESAAFRALGQLQRAMYAITCEASQGRTPGAVKLRCSRSGPMAAGQCWGHSSSHSAPKGPEGVILAPGQGCHTCKCPDRQTCIICFGG